MQIYWDQAFVARTLANGPAKDHDACARLGRPTFPRLLAHVSKGGRYGPYWFAYDDVAKESPWRPITARSRASETCCRCCENPDDMYVIMGPGDETTIEFDATSEKSLPPGWKRDFLLYTDGWIKDSDLNTAFGTTVGPLPYHAVKSYPYGAGDRYPTDPLRQRYLRDYNTRVVTGR